jgi:NAD(P)-dependent dehydrogenase (short-subunit alcohol dehydrogenase family)
VGPNHLRLVNRRARPGGDAAYCASEAGLLGLSAALAKCGRKGITATLCQDIGVSGGLDSF